MWNFQHEDIVACLQHRPWLVNLVDMETHFFRSIVQKEWDKDPWYNCKQAQAFLGLYGATADAFKMYIRRGWIRAERRPGAGGQGEYVIRKSAIDYFLAHDPRPVLRAETLANIAMKRRVKMMLRRMERFYAAYWTDINPGDTDDGDTDATTRCNWPIQSASASVGGKKI